jgi:hypothetical protein
MNQSNPGIGPIRWQDYTHQHMWNMLMAANPEAMFQEAEKATKLANEMGDITDVAHAIAQDVVGAWSGDAADSAAASITEFLQWADHTANTVNKVAGLLSQYAHVVNDSTAPPPDNATTTTSSAMPRRSPAARCPAPAAPVVRQADRPVVPWPTGSSVIRE